jgi:hypothetical protein
MKFNPAPVLACWATGTNAQASKSGNFAIRLMLYIEAFDSKERSDEQS